MNILEEMEWEVPWSNLVRAVHSLRHECGMSLPEAKERAVYLLAEFGIPQHAAEPFTSWVVNDHWTPKDFADLFKP